MIFVLWLSTWKLLCVISTSSICDFHICCIFTIFPYWPNCPLNWTAGQGLALYQQTISITPPLLVFCDWPSGSHSPYLASFNPPPTQDQGLTIALTFRPVDPTLFGPKSLSPELTQNQISQVLILDFWLISLAYLCVSCLKLFIVLVYICFHQSGPHICSFELISLLVN